MEGIVVTVVSSGHGGKQACWWRESPGSALLADQPWVHEHSANNWNHLNTTLSITMSDSEEESDLSLGAVFPVSNLKYDLLDLISSRPSAHWSRSQRDHLPPNLPWQYTIARNLQLVQIHGII